MPRSTVLTTQPTLVASLPSPFLPFFRAAALMWHNAQCRRAKIRPSHHSLCLHKPWPLGSQKNLISRQSPSLSITRTTFKCYPEPLAPVHSGNPRSALCESQDVPFGSRQGSKGLGDTPARHKPVHMQVAIDNLPTSLPGRWFTRRTG